MKNNIRRLTFILLSIAMMSLFIATSVSFAEDAWIAEFEDLCGMTDLSDSLTIEVLKSLIERCDKLKPVIESSDNAQKKVYIFRLDKCKRLFAYTIEVRGNK
jgi:hypothetical protein